MENTLATMEATSHLPHQGAKATPLAEEEAPAEAIAIGTRELVHARSPQGTGLVLWTGTHASGAMVSYLSG